MKTLLSLEGGAVTITEAGGDFTLNFDESLGGGSVAGWLKGKGSIILGSGTVGLKAAEAFLNHLLPASVQAVAAMIEGVLNSAVAAIE
jgi:hypothetical protein